MAERPHATVATVVEMDGRYLLVRERTESGVVINQPAGHIEPGESIIAAAVRETLEETGWLVEPTGFAGLAVYHAANGISYLRSTLYARPLHHREDAVLDQGIVEAVWWSYEQVRAAEAQLRSPLVLKVIEDHRRGIKYPLDLIFEQR